MGLNHPINDAERAQRETYCRSDALASYLNPIDVRRDALAQAMQLASISQAWDPEIIAKNAKLFENYLNGEAAR